MLCFPHLQKGSSPRARLYPRSVLGGSARSLCTTVSPQPGRSQLSPPPGHPCSSYCWASLCTCTPSAEPLSVPSDLGPTQTQGTSLSSRLAVGGHGGEKQVPGSGLVRGRWALLVSSEVCRAACSRRRGTPGLAWTGLGCWQVADRIIGGAGNLIGPRLGLFPADTGSLSFAMSREAAQVPD